MWHEWVDLTAEDYMSIDYVIYLYDNLRYIGSIGRELGFEPLLLEYPNDLVNGINALPTPEFINALEQAVSNVVVNYSFATAYLPSAFWYGENQDARILDFTDVNRWFLNLALTLYCLTVIPMSKKHCGEINCGEAGGL